MVRVTDYLLNVQIDIGDTLLACFLSVSGLYMLRFGEPISVEVWRQTSQWGTFIILSLPKKKDVDSFLYVRGAYKALYPLTGFLKFAWVFQNLVRFKPVLKVSYTILADKFTF